MSSETHEDRRVDVDVYRFEVTLGESDNDHMYSTYPHAQSVLKLVVPHALPYSDFVSYLRNRTWTLLLVLAWIATSSLLLIVSGYSQRMKIVVFECVADVINLLMDDNERIRYQNLHRADIFIVVPLTFTGLVVMNGIVSLLQSYIANLSAAN